MDAADLKALFAPFAPVLVKRMFGGHGIYADGLFLALEAGGEVFVKADGASEAMFRAAGSRPFVYGGGDRPMSMAYWLLPETAYEDEADLSRWCRMALEAAQRAADAKLAKAAGKAARHRDKSRKSS